MSAPDFASEATIKCFSGRTQVVRKILRFSVCIGAAAALLTAMVYAITAYPSVVSSRENNIRALSEINCKGNTCDTAAFLADWEWDDPDYVIDAQTGFFLSVDNPTTAYPGRFSLLDYADPTFGFREPASYETPDGELWRLFSKDVPIDGSTTFEVLVGYPLKEHSQPIAPVNTLIGEVDALI